MSRRNSREKSERRVYIFFSAARERERKRLKFNHFNDQFLSGFFSFFFYSKIIGCITALWLLEILKKKVSYLLTLHDIHDGKLANFILQQVSYWLIEAMMFGWEIREGADHLESTFGSILMILNIGISRNINAYYTFFNNIV